MISQWIQMGEAGKLMNMTPTGAKLRLQRIQEKHQIRFIRKVGGRWEVNVEILNQLNTCKEDYIDDQFRDIQKRLDSVDIRVTALRDVGKEFRKKTEKRLVEHEKRLAALKQLADAANLVVSTFGDSV